MPCLCLRPAPPGLNRIGHLHSPHALRVGMGDGRTERGAPVGAPLGMGEPGGNGARDYVGMED